jgi:hypothetical protein
MCMVRPAAAVLAALIASGCVAGPDEVSDELSENRRRWQAQGIDDYEVAFRNVCFCDPEAVEPVILRVRDGVLVGVTRESDGRPVDPSQWGRYFTVDQAFEFLAAAENSGAHEVRVEYDPALGFPTEAFVDHDPQVADEERGFQMGPLQPLR